MNALNVLCAQLTHDLFAIAKFLFLLTRLLSNGWTDFHQILTNARPIVQGITR